MSGSLQGQPEWASGLRAQCPSHTCIQVESNLCCILRGSLEGGRMDQGQGYARVSVVCCLRFHLRCCGGSPRSRYPLPAWLQALPNWSSAATLYPAVSSHRTQAIVQKLDCDLVAHRLILLGCSPLLLCPEFSTLSQGPHLPPSLTLHLLQVPEHLPLQSSFGPANASYFLLPRGLCTYCAGWLLVLPLTVPWRLSGLCGNITS